MEHPIKDPNLAMEMAYAEKPYREMAMIAFSYEDQALQDEGLRLARLAITTSSVIYDAAEEAERIEKQNAAERIKNKNVLAYIESTRPERFVSDLRKFSLENINSLGGKKRSFTEEAIVVAKDLILEREEEFANTEKRAGIGNQDNHLIKPRDISTKLRELEDKDNWKNIEKQDGRLLLSYTRHILGFRLAAQRASERYVSKIPSFDEVPEDYRKKAYDAITNEWLSYIKLVTDFGASDRVSGKNRPLLYNSMDMLSGALNEERQRYVGMSDSELVDTFENSTNFYHECDWIMADKAQRRLRAIEAETQERITHQSVRANTVRPLELTQALENEEQQLFVSSANNEAVLSIEDKSDIVNVLKAVARRYAVDMGKDHGDYIGTASLFSGFNIDFCEGIRPKGFNGRVENTRMKYLPVTEEFVESFIKKRKLEYLDDFAVIARVGVFSDLYSTGRGKIGESMQEYVLQGRNIKNPQSRNIRISKMTNLSGDKLVEYLNQQAEKIDYIVTHNNMATPLSGGAPSLGKRR